MATGCHRCSNQTLVDALDPSSESSESSESDASCCGSLQAALKAGGLCSSSANCVTKLATEATDVQKDKVG